MKNKTLTILTVVLVIICLSVPCFAENSESAQVYSDVKLSAFHKNYTTLYYDSVEGFDEFIDNIGKTTKTSTDDQDMFLRVQKISSKSYYWSKDIEHFKENTSFNFGFTVTQLKVLEKYCGGIADAQNEWFLYERIKVDDVINVIEYYSVTRTTGRSYEFVDLNKFTTGVLCRYAKKDDDKNYYKPDAQYMELNKEYVIKLNAENYHDYQENTELKTPIRFFAFVASDLYEGKKTINDETAGLLYSMGIPENINNVFQQDLFLDYEAVEFTRSAYQYSCIDAIGKYASFNKSYFDTVNMLWRRLRCEYPVDSDAPIDNSILYLTIGLESVLLVVAIATTIVILAKRSKSTPKGTPPTIEHIKPEASDIPNTPDTPEARSETASPPDVTEPPGPPKEE